MSPSPGASWCTNLSNKGTRLLNAPAPADDDVDDVETIDDARVTTTVLVVVIRFGSDDDDGGDDDPTDFDDDGDVPDDAADDDDPISISSTIETAALPAFSSV